MSDRRHIMLAVGLFLAVLALGGMTLALPNVREVWEIRERVADLTNRSEGVEQTTLMVEQLSKMVADAQRTVDADLKSIPNEAGIALMIRRLSLPIDGETVRDQTFSVGSVIEPLPETHPMIRAVPVTMEMKATFESTYAVLRTIESMERLVRLRSIRINSSTDAINRYGEPIVSTLLVLETVYEEQP